MLTLPWLVARRDLAVDLELTVGEAVPAGTLLGVDPADGRLRPVTAANTRRTAS